MEFLGLGVKRQSLQALLPSNASTSQLPRGLENQLNQALYRFFGGNTPIWIKDDFEEYIRKSYVYNADVYSIVKYILTTAGPTLWTTYRRKNDDVLIPTKPNDKEAGELIKLMRQPNINQSRSSFIIALLGYKLLLGNTYGYKICADKGVNVGKALELYVTPAHITEIVGGSLTNPIGGYKLRYIPTEIIPVEKIMHSKYWNPDEDGTGSGLYGLSPIRAALRLICQSNEAFSANTASFQNMGATGIISQPVQMQLAPETSEMILTKEQMSLIERVISSKINGVKNRGKVAYTSAAIEYHQLGLSAVDMAILGALKLSFQQLCRIWGFPSVLLNDDSNSTYNNMSEARKGLYTDVIMPELNSLAEDMHPWLVAPFADDLVYLPDFSNIECLQDNRVTQTGWLKEAFWLTMNERRIQQDYGKDPNPNMDKYLVPANLVMLDDLSTVVSPDLTEPLKELELEGIIDYKERSNGKH